VLVRRAQADDLPAAVEVWREANTARGRPPTAARVDRVRAKLADPDAVPLVAVDAGTVVGMALAEPGRDDETLCHIAMVFVAPAHWRTGVGVRLLDELAAIARQAGCSRLQVWTRAANEPAAALYRRCGFRASGRTTTLADGEPIVQYVAAV
jgi:ribosomal protein S18 acetylase RimI-like enzyme